MAWQQRSGAEGRQLMVKVLPTLQDAAPRRGDSRELMKARQPARAATLQVHSPIWGCCKHSWGNGGDPVHRAGVTVGSWYTELVLTVGTVSTGYVHGAGISVAIVYSGLV